MKLKNVAVAVVALALAAGMTACGGSASSTAASSTAASSASEAVSSSVAASSEAASSEVETESASSEAASSEAAVSEAASSELLLPLPPESEHSHRLLEILQKASALVFRCRGFFLFRGFYLIPARHGSGQGLPQNGSLPAAGPRKVPCRSSRSARLSGCRSSR